MAVAKKPVKPRTKSTSPLSAAASKKTAPKAKTPEPAAPSAPNAIRYALGDLISHPIFGDGTVAAIDADKLTIEFEGNVMKQIVDYYVKPRKP